MDGLSIYERALGNEFRKLHPRIQERFGLHSSMGVAHVGRGVMEKVQPGGWWTYPLLLVGSTRRILFPEGGQNVPFTIWNYAYIDELGRETFTWFREFELSRRRRFDATMIYSESRGCVVDYVGTHQHIAVDIQLSVEPNGGIRIQSGAQRLYEGPLAIPLPPLLATKAKVTEWFDEMRGQFGIEVHVTNPLLGSVFEYRGWFDNEVVKVQGMPPGLLPKRVERRD